MHLFKLRLLLFPECNRSCRGCCNKEWDLNKLPRASTYTNYKEIILTGGEPMLRPEVIKDTVKTIREQTTTPIFLYTAKSDDIQEFLDVLKVIDGVTLTLHVPSDIITFKELSEALKGADIKGKSLRLNVFRGVSLKDVDTSMWIVKKNIKWIKDCPLPEDEVFLRLK